jgi:hypothetical protein
MCGVFIDATFHGGSNDTIGGRGRLRRPEISPIYPFQLFPILAPAPHFHGVLVLIAGNKFIASVVAGEKLFSSVNDTGDKFIAGVADTSDKFI